MQKYINMNDSFGGKKSIPSTKSFQSSYEQCMQNLQEQVQNHKKALLMAQQLVQQYKEQNQVLLEEIQAFRDKFDRSEQKYEVLQKLFIKLDTSKQKQLLKESRRSQERHQHKVHKMNYKYQKHIESLNKRIFILEIQLQKHQENQRKYQDLLKKYQQKAILENTQIYYPINKKNIDLKKPKKTIQRQGINSKFNVHLSAQRNSKQNGQFEYRAKIISSKNDSRDSTSKKQYDSPNNDKIRINVHDKDQTKLYTPERLQSRLDYACELNYPSKTVQKQRNAQLSHYNRYAGVISQF